MGGVRVRVGGEGRGGVLEDGEDLLDGSWNDPCCAGVCAAEKGVGLSRSCGYNTKRNFQIFFGETE